MNVGRSRWGPLFGLMVGTAVVCLLRILIDRSPDGSLGLAWPDVRFARFRYTALAGGAIVGVALSVSGVLLQSLMRNPLASPFILGVSSGAGLGVMISWYVAYAGGMAMPSVAASTGPALLGAIGVLAVVYSLGRRHGRLDPVTLILVGVVVSTICGAGIMFFQHLVPTGLRGGFSTWLMGHISEGTPVSGLIATGAVAVVGMVVSIGMGRSMDAMALGDDEAHSVGVSLHRARTAMFLIAGILAAASVALAGPIAFVGLISPHIGRLMLGPSHGVLIVGASLLGVILVVGSDVACKGLDLGRGQMPIGVFTSLIGGPLFIWLLISGRGRA